MSKPKSSTPAVTKRRVTMRNFVAVSATEVHTHEAVDYVLPEHLDAYVADARTRWQQVEVSDEPDAGPGGYHGQTAVPAGIDHPEAGVIRPATTPED